MDFPTFERNASQERQPLTVNAPELDLNENGGKTPEELIVEQQWRDVEALGLDKTHPLSINRDSDLVTTDPYGS